MKNKAVKLCVYAFKRLKKYENQIPEYQVKEIKDGIFDLKNALDNIF